MEDEVVTEPGEDLHKARGQPLVLVLKGTHEIKETTLLKDLIGDKGVPFSHQVGVSPHHVGYHCFLTRFM